MGWKRLEVGIREASVPGVLPGSKPTTPEPIRIDLERLALTAPVVTLTRTASGLVLPGSVEPAAAAAATGDGTAAKKTAATPEPKVAAPTTTTPPAAATSPALTVAVGRIDVDGGEVTILDQTVKPFYRGKVSAMTLHARGVRFPENAFDDATFTATLPGGAPLKVDAKQVKGTISVTADGKALPLPQFNPYVMQAAGYSISNGRLTVNTKVRWAPGRLRQQDQSAVRQARRRGAEGDSLFLQKVGIPLQLALSLLRDPYGKIALGVPVKGGKEGTQVDIASIVGQALVQAILGAVTSPLKLLGAASGILTGAAARLLPSRFRAAPGDRRSRRRERATCSSSSALSVPRRRCASPSTVAPVDPTFARCKRRPCSPTCRRSRECSVASSTSRTAANGMRFRDYLAARIGRWERDARAGVPADARRVGDGEDDPRRRASAPSRRRARRA